MKRVSQARYFELTVPVTDFARKRMERDGKLYESAIRDWLAERGVGREDATDMIDYLRLERNWGRRNGYLYEKEISHD